MSSLVRTLRLRDLFLLFIGSVIGSGIFRTPGPILRQVGGSVAALARAFSEYFAKVIPISQTLQTFVAVVVIAIVTAVNVWGTRKSSDLQNWTTLVKASVIVILSAVLLALGRHASEVLPV